MDWSRLRPWLVPAAALVAVLLLAWAWNGERSARGALARQVEEERLRGAGLTTEAEAGRGALKQAEREAVELRDQLEAARRAVPGVRVVEVLRWRTRPDVASGTPRDPAAPQGGGAAAPPVQPSSGGPAGAGCLLAPGDIGEVRVVEAQLAGKAGARAIVGSAEAWRIEPGPPTRLFGGPLRAPAELALVEAERRPPAWGAGLMVAASRDSVGAGPVLLLPPVRVWGVQGEALAGCAAGVRGLTACVATAGVRW